MDWWVQVGSEFGLISVKSFGVQIHDPQTYLKACHIRVSYFAANQCSCLHWSHSCLTPELRGGQAGALGATAAALGTASCALHGFGLSSGLAVRSLNSILLMSWMESRVRDAKLLGQIPALSHLMKGPI